MCAIPPQNYFHSYYEGKSKAPTELSHWFLKTYRVLSLSNSTWVSVLQRVNIFLGGVFFPLFSILSHSCNSPTDSGSCRPRFLTPAHTNVSEDTLFTWRQMSACRRPAHHKESLERDQCSLCAWSQQGIAASASNVPLGWSFSLNVTRGVCGDDSFSGDPGSCKRKQRGVGEGVVARVKGNR